MRPRTMQALLIEDNVIDARQVMRILRSSSDIDLAVVGRLSEGIEFLGQHAVDIVLLDLGLPDSWGLDTLQALCRFSPDIPVVVITGAEDEMVAREAIRLGAQDYLVKPIVETSMLARTLLFALERKKAEKALRESEAKYRNLLESLKDGFVRVDLDGCLREWNSAFQKMVGYSDEELGSMTYMDLTPSEWHAYENRIVHEQIFSRGYSQIYEKEYRRKDGTIIPVELRTQLVRSPSGAPNGMWAIVRDLSESKLMQRQLLHSQKMEAIGRLAGGVAHDFNNLLTVILGCAEQLLEHTPPGSPEHDDLAQIREAGERAASLTSKLLAFSRKQSFQPRTLSLNALIQDNLKILRRLIGEDIQIMTNLAPDLGCIAADPSQIEQVLFNLSVNSRDAMPDGGRLIFETANVGKDKAPAMLGASESSDSFVLLTVRDTGTGMDAETKSHLFEPFFTTKESGKGTGLGLATVYGIVKQSGGFISVESELGKGTAFYIYFPQVQKPMVQAFSDAPSDTAGTETILFVEDMEEIRRFAARYLGGKGYTVLTAGDGNQALEIAEKHAGAIQLCITDVVMPNGRSGQEVAERIQRLCPGIRVIFMTGYAMRPGGVNGLDPAIPVLEKPFTGETLARKIRDALEGTASSRDAGDQP